ncbi:glycosyltransferase [Geitlerinema sp. PCC 9228]|jgi:glycosyltransferase involved in cell wall biosynthesis|uniref:glycosyltransferase family 2 protein n=1 Tax=Geitlerinema sp. PCC 9228 TaxID=111611 RepID=UPI0008F9A759|nr:glycosyltransferase [Geitlerinema sp. PCC 9228]
MPEPKISAVICTHNRDGYLGEAIDSLLAQEFEDFEIIVVDNASTDQTRQVVETRRPNPRLRYIYEENLGLNFARNRGVKESNAAIIAYLDDDAIATPTWLQHIYAVYQNDAAVGAAGGKIDLRWPQNLHPPAWLSKNLAGNLGDYDLGDQLHYIDHPGLTPRGLNYSLRRSVWEQVGGFDLKLDRSGSQKLLSNGDLYMTQRIMECGWKVAYLPEAVVAHQVFANRVNKRWFLNRGWWQGISEYYREELSGETGSGRISRGGERFLRGLVKYIKNVNHPDRRFENLVYAYGQLGYLTYLVKGMFVPEKDL